MFGWTRASGSSRRILPWGPGNSRPRVIVGDQGYALVFLRGGGYVDGHGSSLSGDFNIPLNHG